MLSSIHPLGERVRGNKWIVTAGWYVAGSTAAGAMTGAVLGAVGAPVASRLSATAALVAVATICALAVAGDVAAARVPALHPPGWRRQVNEDWLSRYRGWFYGAGFGFQLGLGIVTIVTTFTLYAYLLIAGLSGSVAGGAVVGAAFGLGRATPLLLAAGVRRADDLRRLHRRLQTAAAPMRHLSLAVLTITALAAVAVR